MALKGPSREQQEVVIELSIDGEMISQRALESRTLHGLYVKIRNAVRDISGSGGYDIVFVDDTVVRLPTDVSEAEMWRQISARRMLHTNPRIDITDQLFRKAKAVSSLKGLSLKQFITGAIEHELQGTRVRLERCRISLPLVASRHPGSVSVTSERIAALLEEEDLDVSS